MERRRACLIMTGSMNPMHSGHVQMLVQSRRLLQQRGYEVLQAVLSPSHDSWMRRKKHGFIPFRHRLAMVQLAAAEHPWLRVSSWEGEQANAIDFPEVCEHLRAVMLREMEAADGVEFFFVCGADLATSCHLYHQPPSANVRAVVVQRAGSSHPHDARAALVVSGTNMEEVSSTVIRQLLREEAYAAIAPFVPPSVLGYLMNYRTSLFRPVHHPPDIARLVEHLKAMNVQVVAFDMDQTLMRLHSHARATFDNVHELAASVTEDFKRIVPVLLHEGFGLAIATHSDEMEVNRYPEDEHANHLLGETLALYILNASMPFLAHNFLLVGYNPSYRQDEDPNHLGKNFHIERICERFHVKRSQVLLYDDDELNVSTAREFMVQKVDPSRGFVIAHVLPA